MILTSTVWGENPPTVDVNTKTVLGNRKKKL